MLERCGYPCAGRVTREATPLGRRTANQIFLRPACLVIALTIALLFVAQSPANAQSEPAPRSDVEQLLQAQLEHGEFAPALRDALDHPAGPMRDERLATIAEAQASSGAVDGFISTLAEIDSDLVRGRVLRDHPADILAQFNDPFGQGPDGGDGRAAPANNGGNQSPQGAQFGPSGNSGGGSQADFDELIDLIISTVEPTSWEDVGGPGSIKEYSGGVHVDVDGMLTRLETVEQGGRLERLRLIARTSNQGLPGDRDVRTRSELRKVSLTRLEKAIQLKLAAGRGIDESMRTLAGMQRVKYVLVYPETGDLVLAGPAGDWHLDRAGRRVSVESGRPVVDLDDFVVVLRHLSAAPNAEFGCSITPRTDGLARARAFAEQSSARPIKARGRAKWLEELRSQLGLQDIETFGIPADTRVARVLVEADYHMKLIGIGLADGTQNVPSYLEMISIPKGGTPPPMDVLRWWFTLNYDALLATPDQLAFELRGQAVKVLSENELLTAQGRRVHTGDSEPLNREFARGFTQHFEDLCAIYPVYAELQNVFDLALTAALIVRQDLPGRVDWHLTCFGDPQQYVTERGIAPTSVASVINHRVINRKHVIAAVSGGVRVAPWEMVDDQAIEVDRAGHLDSEYQRAQRNDLPSDAWWWD